MRIFHVITRSSLGGAQSVVVNLANEQVSSHEVFVISSAGGAAWRALDPKVKVIPIAALKREISPWDIVVFFKLLYYRFKYSPDVVHLHSSKIGVLGRCAFSPRKTVYTVHGFDSVRLANRKFLALEKLLQYWCRFIVGVSRYDLKYLLEEKIRRNVSFIYNGVFDYSRTPVPRNILSELIQEKRKTFSKVVMCIARDNAQKAPDLFAEIAERNPQYFFVWIGNDSVRSNSKNLYWAGAIPEAYLYLCFCDLFVLPSYYEGLPMCILEAFSFSKPVVASHVGGIPELLNGKTGLAVENSVEKFTQAICYFLDDVENYSAACAAARQAYEADYNVGSMVKKYMLLYNEISKKA